MRMNDVLTQERPENSAAVATFPGAVHHAPSWWDLDSWRGRPVQQQPDWPDPERLAEVAEQISLLPPLVPPGEIQRLQRRLAGVAEGRAFLLQAGDCAERFDSCAEAEVRGKVRTILRMAVLMTYGSGLPTVTVGRLAGQYAKPRSSPVETVDGVELPVYRGDIVNCPEPSLPARTPAPERLMKAYHSASATLNVLHGLVRESGTELHRLHTGNEDFVRRTGGGSHAEISEDVNRALRFMSAFGVSEGAAPNELYTSHEALLLDFEQALTRYDADTGRWFDTSAHMVWAGDRTRQLDGAHVEFLSGVANPVGVKIGPSTDPEQLQELCDRLDPGYVAGRLVLISRMGAERVHDLLPPLLRAVRETEHPVVWACDPMHGNTFRSNSGYKTRRLADILAEIDGFFTVAGEEGVRPGGLHLELTGEHVTECLGGLEKVLDADLGTRYETACDPRLNAGQSVELAFRVSELLQSHLR
ncbi:3-deoxy-7-phosphoheptulonate synthase class II [Actinopolyspora erythraea]|uniref:Phospho-2-dehydro-3-deoxyheptonate aldolase n=1 Tax=Actinopolyspora erythraea TaxID=414996 RepID=A0A223RWQ2_9ACTN|nr:3-deoxy-7-phosphoheptulonate synthase class II [Actinopolyspora erythraea]ASU80277.1 3-deoxy-7-phosphoheptulonate synthase class II [Actinopolyspora erythraea]